jgi:hypothetical protein
VPFEIDALRDLPGCIEASVHNFDERYKNSIGRYRVVILWGSVSHMVGGREDPLLDGFLAALVGVGRERPKVADRQPRDQVGEA